MKKSIAIESLPDVPTHVFGRRLRSLAISLLLCIFVVYGVNSILYFTFQVFSLDESMVVLSKGLLYMNIGNGLAVVISFYAFIRWLEYRPHSEWVKYTLLSGIALVINFAIQMFIGYYYWRNVAQSTQGNGYIPDQRFDVFYFLIPSMVVCIYYYFWQRSQQVTRKISEQEFQLLHLEKLKTKAELDALQARINPHFLYNALNSIAGLVHQDADKAEQMTLLLSKLFRYTTGTQDQHYNTVENEIGITETYLQIEQVRFSDRLKYSIHADESVLNVQIPRFLIQPIVENAIKHGISKRSGEGIIEVHISRNTDTLRISIHDNGAPFPEQIYLGYGLQSIQDKLKLLYADRARLEIQSTSYKQIIIELPC